MSIASEGTKIIGALLKVQEKITNPSNTATNPFFRSKYAPLPEILNLVRPLLTENELVIIQNTGTFEDGSVYVKTRLLHSSGESIESDELALKPDKQSAQGIGSAITYGRRYQLTALLGISSEDDDDGNAAEPKKTQPESKGKPTPATNSNKPKSSKNTDQPKKQPKSVNKPEFTDKQLKKLRENNGTIDAVCGTLEVQKKELTKKNILREADSLLKDDSILQAQFNQVKIDLGIK